MNVLFIGSTDYPRPNSQPMGGSLAPQDMRTTDLRTKDPRSQGYPERHGSPYQLPGRDPRDMRGDPRDMRGDTRDMRGAPSAGIDLSTHSIRQSEGMDKVVQSYKGDPRDFDPHRSTDSYRGQPMEEKPRVGMSMVTPPPAHAHQRRSPFTMQAADMMKGRPEMDKSPGLYQDNRQTLSPNVRGQYSIEISFTETFGKSNSFFTVFKLLSFLCPCIFTN